MRTKLIEATNGPLNWGKFLVGAFDTEWAVRSGVDVDRPLLRACGWTTEHYLVHDLQTGEGAIFKLSGHARADLNEKHKIWVCPLFEPFLVWLYTHYQVMQEHGDDFLSTLPDIIDLPDAPFAMYGYRRCGDPKVVD